MWWLIIGIILILVAAWFLFFNKEVDCGDGRVHIQKMMEGLRDLARRTGATFAPQTKDWLTERLKPDKNGCVSQDQAAHLDWESLKA